MVKKSLLAVAIVSLLSISSQTKASFNGDGKLSETLAVGKTLSLGINTVPNGSYMVSVNNSQVISADLQNSNLIVKTLQPGLATVYVCNAQAGSCLSLMITVTASNVLGASTQGIGSHQVGSWLNVGQTIFYVTDNGLIPVPTYQIFKNAGGVGKPVYSANDYDMQLPLLPLMQINDIRVQ